MRKRIEWSWESLDNGSCRAKVYGGWFVVNETISVKGAISTTSIFVADRDHEWVILPAVGNDKPLASGD